MRTRAKSLSLFPERGRPGVVPDTRELPVRRLPYTIVYTALEGSVYILGAYDQRRQR